MKKLFILGDSIAIHYGPYLKQRLNNVCECFFKPGQKAALQDLDIPVAGNGGDSSMVLEFLRQQKSDGNMDYDALLLNCGLHDIKRDTNTKEIKVSIEQYIDNLLEIIQHVYSCNKGLIWMNTTKVDDILHNNRIQGFRRFNKDVLEYNQCAENLMLKYKIPVIDMYGFTETFGTEAYCDHIHFKDEIRKQQAAYLSGFIRCIYNSISS